MEHGLVGHGVLQFLIGRRHRGTRLFPRVLRTPQADRNLQGAFEQALHDQARQTTHDGEIGNQRGELRTKLTGALVGQRRQRGRPAGRTLPTMTAIFRDVRGDRGQLGDLMPSRIADAVPRVHPMRAAATRLRDEIDDRIHTLKRRQLPMAPRMPRLSAGLAPTLLATTTRTLLTCEAIG